MRNRTSRGVQPDAGLAYFANGLAHHCSSHGTPSLSPSIFVPGQFFRKNLASAQDVTYTALSANVHQEVQCSATDGK